MPPCLRLLCAAQLSRPVAQPPPQPGFNFDMFCRVIPTVPPFLFCCRPSSSEPCLGTSSGTHTCWQACLPARILHLPCPCFWPRRLRRAPPGKRLAPHKGRRRSWQNFRVSLQARRLQQQGLVARERHHRHHHRCQQQQRQDGPPHMRGLLGLWLSWTGRLPHHPCRPTNTPALCRRLCLQRRQQRWQRRWA